MPEKILITKIDQPFASRSKKRKVFVLLTLLSSFSCCLFLMRVIRTADLYYGFLVWNLFLGWLPFLFAMKAFKNFFNRKNYFLSAIYSLFWLLFFPNAPYIITDLVHLESRNNIPLWFDAMLVFSFASAGLLLGLFSLFLIHKMINKYCRSPLNWILVFMLLMAEGFGIYIGRVLRWNSWDVFVRPVSLAMDLKASGLSHTSIMMTTLFALYTGITYLIVYYLVQSPSSNADS